MKTTLEKLIQWTIENAFNIETQSGEKFIAIDYEDMKENFPEWLEKEKKQITDAYWNGLRSKRNAKENVAQKYIL
jgi:hypothetical protein